MDSLLYVPVYMKSAVISKVHMALLEMHEKLHKTHMRSVIADWSLLLWGIGDEMKRWNTKQVSAKLGALLNDSSLDFMPLAVLNSLSLLDLNDDALISNRDSFGMRINLLSMLDEQNELTTQLSYLFQRHPDHFGILRILSLLTLAGSQPSVPDLFLDLARYSEPMVRQAASVIKLAKATGEDMHSGVFDNYIREFIQSPVSLRQVFRLSPWRHKVAIPDIVTVEILRRLDVREWELKSLILEKLNDTVRRRISHISDSAIWTKLELPPRLTSS